MDGEADGSVAMAAAAESFHEQAEKLHLELITPERTMSVCEICGVFINSTDNEQRRMVRSHTPLPVWDTVKLKYMLWLDLCQCYD